MQKVTWTSIAKRRRAIDYATFLLCLRKKNCGSRQLGEKLVRKFQQDEFRSPWRCLTLSIYFRRYSYGIDEGISASPLLYLPSEGRCTERERKKFSSVFIAVDFHFHWRGPHAWKRPQVNTSAKAWRAVCWLLDSPS